MLIVDNKGNQEQMQFRPTYAIIVQVQIVFVFGEKQKGSIGSKRNKTIELLLRNRTKPLIFD